MSPTEKKTFTELLMRAFRFAGKELTAKIANDWWEEFEEYPIAELDAGLRHHRRFSPYLPKPSDLYRSLEGADGTDGRPGAEEAWGLLVRMIGDERETGLLSEEIRAGWKACQPILDTSDPIGARKCFLEAYAKRVQDARAARRPVHWTVTLGTDPVLRQERLAEAVQAGRLSEDHARALLPDSSTATLDDAARLLEGPDASEADHAKAQRFHAFAGSLRKIFRDEERNECECERRARETAARPATVQAAQARAGTELPQRREPPETNQEARP